MRMIASDLFFKGDTIAAVIIGNDFSLSLMQLSLLMGNECVSNKESQTVKLNVERTDLISPFEPFLKTKIQQIHQTNNAKKNMFHLMRFKATFQAQRGITSHFKTKIFNLMCLCEEKFNFTICQI